MAADIKKPNDNDIQTKEHMKPFRSSYRESDGPLYRRGEQILEDIVYIY